MAKLWGVDIAMKKDIEVSEELYQEGRKAANKEQNELLDRIFGKDKPQYKVGDYVVPTEEHGKHRMHNRKTDRAYILLNFLSYDNVQLANEHGKDDDSGKMAIIHIRPATSEEIKKAQYLPEGTPCFVRENKDYSWKLAYVDGNGNFYKNGKKSGDTYKWNFVHKYSDGLPEE